MAEEALMIVESVGDACSLISLIKISQTQRCGNSSRGSTKAMVLSLLHLLILFFVAFHR